MFRGTDTYGNPQFGASNILRNPSPAALFNLTTLNTYICTRNAPRPCNCDLIGALLIIGNFNQFPIAIDSLESPSLLPEPPSRATLRYGLGSEDCVLLAQGFQIAPAIQSVSGTTRRLQNMRSDAAETASSSRSSDKIARMAWVVEFPGDSQYSSYASEFVRFMRCGFTSWREMSGLKPTFYLGQTLR